MEEVLTYRGRSVNATDVETVTKVIDDFPNASRRFVSQELCRIWNWRQRNGQLKDMVCRGLLLLLESRGLVKLPARKRTPHNPLVKRKKPEKVEVDQSPVECELCDISVSILQVRKTRLEKTFDSLVDRHHYLGYTRFVGEHLKYMAFRWERPVACIAWASAPWHIKARDRFIGWTKDERRENLHLIANNTRFLVLPWIRIPCLASHLLAVARKRLSADWIGVYNHPIHLAETFVDPSRFAGTCYKADNWILAGETSGRGKANNTRVQKVSKKAVFVRALSRDFRRRLRRVS